MPLNCVVYGCNSSHKKDKSIKFFRFPQDEEYKKKWVDLCKRKEPINTDVARVCSLHFEPSAFKRLLKYELLNLPVPPNMKRLLDGALPTLNMPNKQVPLLPRRDAPVLLVQPAIQPVPIQQAAWPNQPVLMVQSPSPLGQLNQSAWSSAPVQVVQSTTPGGPIQHSTWSTPQVQVVQSTNPCVMSTNTLGSVNQSTIGPVYVLQPTGLQDPVQQSACSKTPILLVQSPTPCGPLRKDELGASAPAADSALGSVKNSVGSVQESTCNMDEQPEDSTKRKHSVSEELSSVINGKRHIKKEKNIDESDFFIKEWEIEKEKQQPNTVKLMCENRNLSNVTVKEEPCDSRIVIKQENDIDSVYLGDDNSDRNYTTVQSQSISEPETLLPSAEKIITSQRQTRRRSHGRTRLVSQARNIILNVFKYFRRQGDYEHIEDLEKRTAEAAQVSVRTVSRIRTQGKRSPQGVIESPERKKRTCSVMDKVDDFSREAIRREILSFYESGELPTLDLLLDVVTNPPVAYQGSRSTLWKLVRDLGFNFKKHGNRAILMEKTEIVASRNKYLQEIELNRTCENPRPEVYLDETWVNHSTCTTQCRTNKEEEGFIIVHAGGAQGFIPGALLMFESKLGNKFDYHDSMNSDTFKQWFVDQLLPNIPERSLIVLDNAHYHCALVNQVPSLTTQKVDIVKWLTENSIPHDSTSSRPELLYLAKLHKKRLQRYEIDELAMAEGHKVLRLPPYYCQLNPIELIWIRMKEEIKRICSDTDQNFTGIEEVAQSAITCVSPEHWRRCIKHTKSLEDDYRRKYVAFESMFESFDLNVSLSDSSSDESEW
ncbi:uncharacterized protein LOC143022948 [Oratosquilla oratoria]|uniref:uncharacterized protein LOC143022948 n=1 Tax=Oratosquilla oratoria TaxID=337810 RepID=UPI003F769E74